jgi:hypothetical protein
MTSDQWVEIIKVTLAFVSTIVLGVLTFLTARLNKSQARAADKVEDAAAKVEVVRKVLEESTAHTDIKLDAIHKQVNGAMSVQMKLVAMSARRLANLSGHIEDAKAADMAEQALKDHEQIQGHL